MTDSRVGGPVLSPSVLRRLRPGPTIILTLLALAVIVGLLIPAAEGLVGPLGTLVGFAAASVTILRKTGSMDGRERVAWRLIGMGFGLGTVGMVTVSALEILDPPVPAFGPTDLFFIATYAGILAGFAYLPHQSSSPLQRLRVYLDSAIGAISVGILMWVLVLDHLVHALAGATAWERWAGTAYPLLDVAAVIVVVTVVSRRSAFRFDPRLLLFAVGVSIQAFADIEYLRAGVGRSFGEVDPNFAAFVIAATFYYLAALISDRSPKVRSYADRPASVWSMIGPYAAALALVSLVISEIQLSRIDGAGRLALVATLVVGVLVVIRQSVAIHENRRLVDRQRSDLVRSISHELRTPLTAIVGFLEELAGGNNEFSESERRELLEITAAEARYLQHLVADLAPLRSGGGADLVLEEAPIEIGSIVQRAIGITRAPAEAAIEDDLVVVADPNRIQQALVNLLSNAQRYGAGQIHVVAYRRGADAILEVHDNGPGVAKKWELAIWDRFERGENRYDASRPGSGIGLAMVAAIAEAHGGQRYYKASERLGGACFVIEFIGRVVEPLQVTWVATA